MKNSSKKIKEEKKVVSEDENNQIKEKECVSAENETSKTNENAVATENDIAIEKSVEKDATEKDIVAEKDAQQKPSRKSEFIEFLKFLCFSLSAGAIQLGSFTIMYELIGWKEWWACHLISLTLSVVWNFTFNRKFTFKSASNVPLAMSFAFLFYVGFTPASIFGGNALKDIGWNGTLVEMLMMVINFVLEFVWDKFIVFNDKLMGKISEKLRIKKKEGK